MYAHGIEVGAPPDAYNQHGQDWSQPPWRPDRLAETGYEPFRRMVSTVLRHAGGIRVDHVIGLFRLWWIPEGHGPTEGTYVRYDHEAMVGILALEAHRAGALVVGEDLGTVEPWVRDYLRERGILGTSILWFEFEWDAERRAAAAGAVAGVLPRLGHHPRPAADGRLSGRRPCPAPRRARPADPAAGGGAGGRRGRAHGLAGQPDRPRGALQPGASVEETVEALHRYLTWTRPGCCASR